MTASSRNKDQVYAFEFTGSASEYSKVWIRNVVLTILTLGGYSSWGVVINRHYFYSRTRLDGEAFHYHGDPVKIMKGRVFAFVVLLAYIAMLKIYPPIELAFTLLLFCLIPWMILKAFIFNATCSSYRNVHFHFMGEYSEALKIYIGIPLLVIFTLGFAYPYLVYENNRFMATKMAYGHHAFSFNAKCWDFYNIYLTVFFIFIGPALVFAISLSFIATLGLVGVFILATLVILFFLYVYSFVQAAKVNLFFNALTLNEHRFVSSLDANELFVLYLGNMVGVLFSLGLYIPWAKIRLAQYRVSKIMLTPHDSIENIVATEKHLEEKDNKEMHGTLAMHIGF